MKNILYLALLAVFILHLPATPSEAKQRCITEKSVEKYMKGGWHRFTMALNGKTYTGEFTWKPDGKAVVILDENKRRKIYGKWKKVGKYLVTNYRDRRPSRIRYRIRKTCT